MADTSAIAKLRSRISDILMSDSCQKIDFWWGPYLDCVSCPLKH